MTPELLSFAALVCFAAGAALAIAGFRVAALNSNVYQFISAGLGMLLKTFAIGLNCVQSDTHFFNSHSEICGLLAWALAGSYLLALGISGARSLGALSLPVIVLLLALSEILSKRGTDPGVSGRLFAAHILSAFLGYALFLTACGASVLYLEQARLLKRKIFGVLFRDLPSLERTERLEIICCWLGLFVFTAALASGAYMARELKQPFWLEPKFLSAQVTWLIFFTLVVGRGVRWLNGRSAAWFALAGAVLVLLTFALGHPFGQTPVAAVLVRPGGAL